MIKINPDLCIGCGICLESCGTRLLKMNLGTNIPYLAYDYCSDCGHCLAVCPQKAITLHNYSTKDFIPIKKSTIELDSFIQLTKQRRSYRNFKNKVVPRQILEKIIASTQYLPTGCNYQELEYTILTNPQQIQQISAKMHKKFSLIKFLTNNFPLRQIFKWFFDPHTAKRNITGPERLTTSFEEGKDLYLRDAPAVIVIHTRKRTEMMHLDAGIAGHHINLACETEGLGMCWIGFHSSLAQYFPSIKRLSTIPRKHKILATLVVGYPKLHYFREIPRKDPIVKILDS